MIELSRAYLEKKLKKTNGQSSSKNGQMAPKVGAGSRAPVQMTELGKRLMEDAKKRQKANAVTGVPSLAESVQQNIYTPGQAASLQRGMAMGISKKYTSDLGMLRDSIASGKIFEDSAYSSMLSNGFGDGYDQEKVKKVLLDELDNVLGINVSTYDSARARQGDWSVLDGLDEGSDQYKEYYRLLRKYGYDETEKAFKDVIPTQSSAADMKKSMMLVASGDLPAAAAQVHAVTAPAKTYEDLFNLQQDYTRDEVEKDLSIIAGFINGGYVSDYGAYEEAAKRLGDYFGGDWSVDNMRSQSAAVPILGENNIPWYDDTIGKYDADTQVMRDKMSGQNFTYEDYVAYWKAVQAQQEAEAQKNKFLAEWSQKMQKWDPYFAAADFEKYSADLVDPYANTGFYGAYNAYKGAMHGDQNDTTGYAYMSKDELKKYSYLANNPQYGKEVANEYLKDLQENLYRLRQEDIVQRTAEAADEHGASMWIGARGSTAWNNMVEGPKNIVRNITGQEITPYDPSFDAANYAQITDAVNVQNIKDATNGVELLGINLPAAAYQAVSSSVDSGIAALYGGKSASVLFGTGTFNTTLQEGLKAGKDQMDAAIDAAVDGLIEVGTEKFSIDALLGDGTSALKHLFKNALTEPTEELFGEILRESWDAIRNGDDSEFNRRISELQYQGYAPDEALRQAWKERAHDILETEIVSFLSGDISGSFGAVNIYNTNRQYGDNILKNGNGNTRPFLDTVNSIDGLDPSTKKMIQQEYAAQDALDAAQKDAEPPKNASEQTFDEFDESTAEEAAEPSDVAQKAAEPTKDESEQVFDEFAEETAEPSNTVQEEATQKTAEQKPSGKKDSKAPKSSAARLGRIFREAMSRLDEQSKAVLADYFSSNQITAMLDDRAALDKVAPDAPMKKLLANAVAKVINGQQITREEARMLTTSNAAMATVRDLTAAVAERDSINATAAELAAMADRNPGKSADQLAKEAEMQEPAEEAAELESDMVEPGLTIEEYAAEYGSNADLVKSVFDSGSTRNATEFAHQFKIAYNYGSDGRNLGEMIRSGRLDALTDAQKTAAYNLGRDVRIAKYAAARETSPTGVTVGNVDRSAISGMRLNAAQNASVSAIGRLAKAVGFNVKFVASQANADGKYTSENGRYDRATRTITIDVNAGRLSTESANYAMMQTAGHELTHYIKQFADTGMYSDYQEFVLNHLSLKMKEGDIDARIQNTIDNNAKLGNTLTREQAIDEIVADASGDVLMSLTESDIREMAQTKPTLLQTIGKFFERWISSVKALIKQGYSGQTNRNAIAEQMLDVADELGRKWVALLKDANVRAVESTGELLVTTKQGAVVSAEVAEVMNSDRYEAPDNGLLSVRETDAWAEAHRKEYPNDTNFADNLALIQKFDADVVQDAVLRYLVPHGRIKKTAHGPLRDNIEYVYTFDMDTKCERTYQFLAYRNAVQKKIGRQLTENEARNLIELMRAYGQMIPCTYCYVEGKRMTLADLYLKYIDKNSATALGTSRSAEEIFDGVERARTIVSGWLNDRFNITDNYSTDPKYASDSFDGYRDFKMPITEEQAVDEVCERYSITDKAAKKVIAGYVAEWVYNRQMDLPMQLVNEDADFRTDTIEQDVLAFHDRATKAAQGGAKARGIEDYEPYIDQVKNISLEDKAYINGMGGIRKHSSNDFQIQNVQDYMLFFMDLAADKRGGTGWMGHTYTKNLDYARIFAPTNDRINVSIAMYGDKNTGIRPNTQEGVDWEELKKVRAKYKNVGAMAMVTNNDQLSLAMNSDWIDMIIPFHASGMKRSLYRGLGWLDYTSKQSERVYTKDQMVDMLREVGIPVKASAKAAEVQQLFMENFDIKTVYNEKTGKRIAPHFFPGDTVQHGVLIPGHHNNAQRYFELCREYGVNPRFYGINVEDANGNLIPITDHPGYLKLIKETARTDTPQEEIVAKFDMDAVNSAMKAFKGYANLSEDAYGIVDEFVSEYVGKNRPFRYLTERAKETQAIIEEMSAQEQAKRDRMRERMLESIDRNGGVGVAENAMTSVDDGISFSVREGEEPKTSAQAYKLFNVDENGMPHALFIDAANALELGTWYNADSPLIKDMESLEPGATYYIDRGGNAELRRFNNKAQSPSKSDLEEAAREGGRFIYVGVYKDAKRKGQKSYANWGLNGSGQISTFAMRPGWHMTNVPAARHIGAGRNGGEAMYRRPNQRWFLVEYATDVDYSEEAAQSPTKDIATHIPTDGWYSFRTNTNAEADQDWIISGALKIVRPVSEREAHRIAQEAGVPEDLPYKDGVKAFTEDDIDYQARDPYQITDREILANAMDSVAKNKDELDVLQRYRARVAELSEKQDQLEQINARIVETRKAGGSRDEIIKDQNRAQILQNQIDRLDKQLQQRERAVAIQSMAKRERDAMRIEYEKTMRKRETEQLNRRLERQQERYDKLKDKYDRDIAEQKQRVKDVRAEKNESFAREKYLNDVRKSADKMRKLLTTPTNKEHVPEFLRAPLGDFIEALDFSSVSSIDGKGSTKADERLKAAMDRLHSALVDVRSRQNGDAAKEYMGYIDLPYGFVDEFNRLRTSIGVALDTSDQFSTPVNRMNSEQLHELAKAFRVLHTSIRNMNRLLANAKFASAIEAVLSTLRYLEPLVQKNTRNKLMGKALDFIDWKNTVPYYVFKRFGKGGMAIFEGLMDGWDKLALNADEVVKFTNSAYSTKEVQSWEKEIHDVTLSSGETVRMTTAQLMSLYCLARREQARGHLLGGGIRIADIEGKARKVIQTENYTLTQADLNRFGELLTARQREVADKLQRYMAVKGAEWGNYVSMKRFGYNMFTEANYFPVEADRRNMPELDPQAEENSMYRLLNMSATKGLVENANNALVVRSIFDVFTGHMSDMAKYNALGLQMLDAIKWFNFVSKETDTDGTVKTVSVRKALESAYGDEARKYFNEFMRNLNGETEGGREDGFLNRIISRYKVAATAANLRVALLQITSMPRAAYVISPKYLAIGIAKWNASLGKNSGKAVENVGIAKWKSMGFYDTNISRSMRELIKHDQTVTDKVREGSMKLAEWGDEWTLGVLYGAVEAELKAKGVTEGHPDFKRQMNNRMREIVYQTQVVDSTMTRSHLMRQKGKMATFTSFMSESTIAVNVLNDAIFEARMKARSGDKNWFPASLPKVARAIAVTIAVSAPSALVEALMAAFRDDDEFEEFAEKFNKALLGDYSSAESFADYWAAFMSGSVGGNLNVLSNIPIVKNLLESAQGSTAEEMVTKWISTLGEGVTSLYKVIMEPDSTTADYYRAVYKTVNGMSQLTGIAAGGAMRDVVAVYNTFGAEPMGWKRIQTYDNSEKEAARAIFAAQKAGDDDLAAYYRERFALYGMDEEKLSKALAKLAEDAYIEGGVSRDFAADMLSESGKSGRKVEKALTQAEYEIETGLEYGSMKEDFVAGTISEEQARAYLKEYSGMRDREIDEKLGEWRYEKDTGYVYSAMKEDYLDGELTEQEAINHRVEYGGADVGDARETVNKWRYEKDTGLVYSEMKLDYEDGVLTESQVRSYLAEYGGKDEEKIEETISQYDYYIATGRTTTAPKYWRIAYAYDSGGDADTLIKQAFDEIMYGGEKNKSWKQARSQLASSLAAYYKKDYLAVKGTEKGNRMLERILTLYEKIGYTRSYQSQYIEENWTDD